MGLSPPRASPAEALLEPLRPGRLSRALWRSVLTACLGAMHFGFAMGYTSPCLKGLREELLSGSVKAGGTFSSLINIGALAGALSLGGPISERLGRRAALALSTLPGLGGWALIGLARAGPLAWPMLAAGRLLTGVSVGIQSQVVPMYITEIAPAQHRGPSRQSNPPPAPAARTRRPAGRCDEVFHDGLLMVHTTCGYRCY